MIGGNGEISRRYATYLHSLILPHPKSFASGRSFNDIKNADHDPTAVVVWCNWGLAYTILLSSLFLRIILVFPNMRVKASQPPRDGGYFGVKRPNNSNHHSVQLDFIRPFFPQVSGHFELIFDFGNA